MIEVGWCRPTKIKNMDEHLPQACLDNPPVLEGDYEPVGRYLTINDYNTYVTGSAATTNALLFFYDGMGWKHQTFTACDLLASLIPDTVVLMPDFFKGQTMPLEIFNMPPDQKSDAAMEWLNTVANPNMNKEGAEGIIENAGNAGFLKVRKWACFGLCRGGKLTAMMSGPETPFTVAGVGHPAGLKMAEASTLGCPFVCLFSPMDYSAEVENALQDNGQDTYVELYEDRRHGWMGARCNFQEQKDKAEYERAYKTVASFIAKHLA